MSTHAAAAQQFSLNSIYGNSGGYWQVLRVQKALLGVFQP